MIGTRSYLAALAILVTAAPAVAQDGGAIATDAPSAMLFEEDGASFAGSVEWRVIAGGTHLVVVAETAFPERGLRVDLVIARGDDATSPYSHRIDVLIDADEGGPIISSVTGIAMADTQDELGDRLVSQSSMPGADLFRFDLPREAVGVNRDAIEKLGWLAVPLIYAGGGQAAIVISKGAAGDRVFAAAAADWADPPPEPTDSADGVDLVAPAALPPDDGLGEGDGRRQVQVIRIGPNGEILD